MTKIGTVIANKYEILKEIGRGGMSVVYLAMDKNLNKQWAVKEIRKKGSGKNDEIVVNSLIAEANLMKKLDHSSLPRIVDIIDNGITIYVIMDYIEGESLDKILKANGPQPEDLVIGWAKQLCDALSYLHSQKPPIVYRDMKPANIMLKPEGNIKIIDFGIAREYKEQNLADTTVLGTKGYAPPEQYSGQTDPRSDIFALGMTMHHLLTGVDPRNGEPYAPVRQWNPELSEGIEIIIDKCVEPAAEHRYQSCMDLLFDLEHPDLITKGYKKKQKNKLVSFIASLVLAVSLGVIGVVLDLTATRVNNHDYEFNLAGTNPDSYYAAIEIIPERVDAYEKLINYYEQSEDGDSDKWKALGIAISNHKDVLNPDIPEVAEMYYDAGKLFFSKFDDFKTKANESREFFKIAVESNAQFDKKKIAECYYSICVFMTNVTKTTENSLEDFDILFDKIEEMLNNVDESTDREAKYDKLSVYYVTMIFLKDQAKYMPGVGVDKDRVLDIMERLYHSATQISSNNDYVKKLITDIEAQYDDTVEEINANFNEYEKRHEGGN